MRIYGRGHAALMARNDRSYRLAMIEQTSIPDPKPLIRKGIYESPGTKDWRNTRRDQQRRRIKHGFCPPERSKDYI